ncbi:MAG: type II toxin-antitoxin system Phd/YefM family antitoxin [Deltaproteobacteria bacterium]|nr:type II toxin-antitoxin system Phd/YefM family antitoxin [Deltaproteobacteria bacterium]
MKPLKLTEDLRPLSDLKSRPGEVVRQVQDTGRPVVITRHGRGVAVLISLEEFEEYRALMARRELQRELDEAIEDVAAGRTIPHSVVVKRWEDRLGVTLPDGD